MEDWFARWDVTSTFKGVSVPAAAMYDKLHSTGWTVQKVVWTNGRYEATASSPHGEKITRHGPDEATALSHVYMHILRREHGRTAAQLKVGMWDHSWENDIEAIANAYAQAPVYDPRAAQAWVELANDSKRRAEILGQQLKIEVTDEPEPYANSQQMCDDIHRNKHFVVSRANSDHPVWTVDENVAFRIVHDVLGHCVSGGDFGWAGENRACAAHFPLLSPLAQQALFTECIGQTAYAAHYRSFGPQKVAFLKEFLEPAQQKENPAAHTGVDPQHTLAPVAMPSVQPSPVVPQPPTGTVAPHQESPWGFTPVMGPAFSKAAMDWQKYYDMVEQEADPEMGQMPWTPGRSGKCFMGDDGRVYSWNTDAPSDNPSVGVPHHTWMAQNVLGLNAMKGSGWIYPDGRIHFPYLDTEPTSEEALETIVESIPGTRRWEPPEEENQWTARTAAVDPNADWQSASDPLPNNAYLWQNDPLEAHKVMENGQKVDTGWANFTDEYGDPDYDKMKQAIVNAFRVVLLSPRKNLRWNAIHYQDISGIPADETDPKVYWDTLEARRRAHNVARGRHPEAHMPWFKEREAFYQYVYALDHDLGPERAKQVADDRIYHMRMQEEQRITEAESHKPEEKRMSADEVERKVDAALKKRLKLIVDHNPKDDMDVSNYPDPGQISLFGAAPQQTDLLTGEAADLYGAWMGQHLKSIAQISRHSDELLDAALEDVREHDGTGHHFRAKVLSLNVPGVGPKVCSFAWLLLQPMTSQLGTIDVHMMRALGHDYDKEMNNRDYFKFERELAAGRDAAGYAHLPLGLFQWGLWDHQRTGPGTHQDHSALRVLDPMDHRTVDWAAKANPTFDPNDPYVEAQNQWWSDTEPARQQAAQEFDSTLGVRFPQSRYPFQEPKQSATIIRLAKDEPEDELHLSIVVPEDVRVKIKQWVDTLPWPDDHEKQDPGEYHITVLYSETGYQNRDWIQWAQQHNATGIAFRSKSVETFENREGKDLDPVVLELDSKDFGRFVRDIQRQARNLGIPFSSFQKVRPHITIGRANDFPADEVEPLDFSFRGGPLAISRPRGLPQREDFRIIAKRDFEYWWKNHKPFKGKAGAERAAEYAVGTDTPKSDAVKWINDHLDDIHADHDDFKRWFRAKYDRLKAAPHVF